MKTDPAVSFPTPNPRLSLVICNRNQRDRLQTALAGIDAATMRKHQAELILVDRDSIDGSPEVIEAFLETATFPVKALFEPRRGLSHARNLALEIAVGDIVGVFDEPVAPDDELLTAAAGALADPSIAFATGHPDQTEVRTLYARNFLPADLFEHGPFFFRSEVAEKLNGFDPHYASDPEFRGDDLDFALRAAQAGFNGAAIPARHVKTAPQQLSARRLSAGAVYLHHSTKNLPEVLAGWLGSLPDRSAKPFINEGKGALRSLWQSETCQHYFRRPLFQFRNPRAFHVFGLGTSKSGTHSLHALCEQNYWSGHEPEDREFIQQILGYETGRVTREEMKRFLLERDRRMYLEMDASNLNIHVTELLVELFPHAKFILTVRDCLGWVDSEINHKLSRPFPRAWQAMWNHRYQSEKLKHSSAEKLLAEHNLYTLDGYLAFWNWHNRTALEKIPAERLLVRKTKAISHSTEAIAKFIGVPHEKLDVQRAHAFGAAKKYGILAQLDPAFVHEKARAHCAELMAKLFPELPFTQPPTSVA